MIGLVLLILVAIAGLVLYGVAQVVKRHIGRHGLLVLIGRWLGGKPRGGRPVTNAGWRRPGTKALTRTGHAPRFHYLPTEKRVLRRTGPAVVLLAVVCCLLLDLHVTLEVLAAAAGGALVLLVVRFDFWLRRRPHYRAWVKPTHMGVADKIGVPIAAKPSYLEIEPDRSKARILLPQGQHFDDKAKKELEDVVTSKLGIDAKASWEQQGPEPQVTFTKKVPPAPPPPLITLDGDPARNAPAIRPAIVAARAGDMVWGYGYDMQVVKTAVDGEAPMTGLSIPTGGGKSTAGRFMAAQMAYHGALVVILDVKRISHAWARGLPNVAIAKTPAEIYTMLMWLAGDFDDGRISEMERRYRVADADADIEGEVKANVGPPIFVLVEEMNTTQARVKTYYINELWERGMPRRCPAAEAGDQLMFTGRQARFRLVQIGQRLSVAATSGAGGTADARGQIGAYGLFDPDPATVKMLGIRHPIPPARGHIGRLSVVTPKELRECQVPFITGQEAHDLALAGNVAHPRSDMPFIGGDRPVTAAATRPQVESAATAAPLWTAAPVAAIPAASEADLVGLREAIEVGILTGTLKSVQHHRDRDPNFPKPKSRRGTELLYDAEELAAWQRARDSKSG